MGFFSMLGTAPKITIARVMSRALLRAGLRPVRRVRRSGLTFELDLREGIDLSLFLFGSFQRHILKVIQKLVPRDGTAIDIGANIGAITLPLAAHLTGGRVYAIEPTDYAFGKLEANLALNPDLARRVTAIQSLVADRDASQSTLLAYSSWPIAGEPARAQHPIHKGVNKATSCGQVKLGTLLQRFGIAAGPLDP